MYCITYNHIFRQNNKVLFIVKLFILFRYTPITISGASTGAVLCLLFWSCENYQTISVLFSDIDVLISFTKILCLNFSSHLFLLCIKYLQIFLRYKVILFEVATIGNICRNLLNQ